MGHMRHGKRNSVLKTAWSSHPGLLLVCSLERMFQFNVLKLFEVEKPETVDPAVWLASCDTDRSFGI